MSETAPLPPAGWYPHPSMAGTQQYWDGIAWTEYIAPMSGPTPDEIARTQSRDSGIDTLGVLLAIVIPIVGLVFGLARLNKPNSSGVAIILISVVSFVVWYFVLTNMNSSPY